MTFVAGNSMISACLIDDGFILGEADEDGFIVSDLAFDPFGYPGQADVTFHSISPPRHEAVPAPAIRLPGRRVR
jgi:hypothetical protein